jgi:hypothetical protein
VLPIAAGQRPAARATAAEALPVARSHDYA